jgi:hypothetical protein
MCRSYAGPRREHAEHLTIRDRPYQGVDPATTARFLFVGLAAAIPSPCGGCTLEATYT